MQITRTGAPSRQGPAEHFTGTVRLEQVAAPELPSRLRMFNVHFAPGARTAWHTHPHGQVLYVLSGEGLVQRAGGKAEVIRPGDAVWIEPGERHWHGAGPRTAMSHLATVEAADDGTTVCWGEHVGPDLYSDA